MRQNVQSNQEKKYKRVNFIPRLYGEKRPGWTEEMSKDRFLFLLTYIGAEFKKAI